MATAFQSLLAAHKATGIVFECEVPVTITNGAAAGTFDLPAGSYVREVQVETPVAVPGSPTNTYFRLGSAADGAQYIANTDIKGQGVLSPTIVYAGRNPASTVHYTVASSGGTAADQDSEANIRVFYTTPIAA